MENPIHVFAARVHAHGLGKVITAYKYDKKVIYNWLTRYLHTYNIIYEFCISIIVNQIKDGSDWANDQR